jgi:hypothetical protein
MRMYHPALADSKRRNGTLFAEAIFYTKEDAEEFKSRACKRFPGLEDYITVMQVKIYDNGSQAYYGFLKHFGFKEKPLETPDTRNVEP